MRAIINVFTRMRFCSPRGTIAFDDKARPARRNPASIRGSVPGHAPRGMNIVFGHWSTLGLSISHNTVGSHRLRLGRKLTAMALDEDTPRFVQVPQENGADRRNPPRGRRG